jgi:hypothetical protein
MGLGGTNANRDPLLAFRRGSRLDACDELDRRGAWLPTPKSLLSLVLEADGREA